MAQSRNLDMDLPRRLPVTVISGFLGSGKTTLINHLLNNANGRRFAIIVNDMAEVNIDADLVRARGAGLSFSEESLVEMTNGCICCTLREDLLTEVKRLAQMHEFDALVIESTGIGEPLPVAATFDFEDSEGFRLGDIAQLDTMVTIVDAVNILSDYNSRDFLADRGQRRDETDERSLVELLVDQIEFADVIVLNKCSDVNPEKLDSIKGLIRSLNPTADLIETDRCQAPLQRILATGRFDFEAARRNPLWFREMHGFADHRPETEEYGIQSYVFRARHPFDPRRLHQFLRGVLPGVIRAKGYFWVSSQPKWAFELSLAGAMMSFKPFGRWWAATPRQAWPRDSRMLARIQRDWREPFGDRRQELVFIGRGLDTDWMERSLNSCLFRNATPLGLTQSTTHDPFQMTPDRVRSGS